MRSSAANARPQQLGLAAMFKPLGLALLMTLELCCCKAAFSCEAIDTSFELSGLIISGTANNYQASGGLAHLWRMLKATYPTKAGEPKIQSAHLSVNGDTQILSISYELENKRRTPSIDYDVDCIGGEWGYSISRQLSTDGIYREVEQKVRLKVLPNGSIEVRNEDAISRGLIFKTKELYLVTARFSNAGIRRAAD
jgi:hypothetical protein